MTVLYPRDLHRLDAGEGVSGRVRDSMPVKFQVHSSHCRDTNEVRMKFGSYGSYVFRSYEVRVKFGSYGSYILESREVRKVFIFCSNRMDRMDNIFSDSDHIMFI